MKRERRRARQLALQTLYEVEAAGHPAEAVLSRHLAGHDGLSESSKAFLREAVFGSLEHAARLDEMIAACAPEWPVDELTIIDRSILRLALWELHIYKETPLKVAINEAVVLAKRYSSDSAPRFVNGVLGSLAPQP